MMANEVDFEYLRRLHPVVATLVWLTVTGRLENNDRMLSRWLLDSSDREKLDGESGQWVLMVDGANLSKEARLGVIDFLLDYIPVVDNCGDRQE
jgi:hypothetical protein